MLTADTTIREACNSNILALVESLIKCTMIGTCMTPRLLFHSTLSGLHAVRPLKTHGALLRYLFKNVSESKTKGLTFFLQVFKKGWLNGL